MVLSGLCGRIWTLARDYPRLDGPEDFAGWSEPGTVRVAFAHWVDDLGDGRAELVSEARVEPVDRRAAMRLRALWAVIGRFERLVGAEPLALAARRAELQAGDADSSRSTTRRPRRTTARSSAREVVLGAQDRAALGRHGDGEDVRGGSPLALEHHRPARRPAADPPLAAARLGGHDRARRRQGGDLAARAGDERGGGQRAAQPAAGERGHRARRRRRPDPTTSAPGTRRPSSSPRRRRSRRATPLAAEHRLAADARREQVRMPVLRQPRGGLGDAEPAERPPRPRHAALEHGLEPGVLAEVDAPARRSDPRSTPASPSQAATPSPSGSAHARGAFAQRTKPPGCAASATVAHGPSGARQTPHSATIAAARRGVGKPPVVALHRDAVGPPRVAERRVGPGTAIRGEEAQRSISACVSGMPKRDSASASPSSSR